MNAKKLLICSPSNAIRGGVEAIVQNLVGELPKRGWDTILALAKGARFNDVQAYRSAYPGLDAVEIDGTKGTRPARLDALTNVIKLVRPDVVLSARIFDAYEATARLKSRMRDLRLATTIQTYEPPYLFDAKLYRNNIDLCITAGNLTRVAVDRWSGIGDKRAVAIPNGVHPPIVSVAPRIQLGQLRIGYVGRLEEGQKRISDLIPFLERLDQLTTNYTLDIAGTGPAESEIKKQAQRWIDCGRLIFHGWQSRESLYTRVYPELDCLIHFAHTEGVPIAPGEALVHGVVPVISRFSGVGAEHQFIDGYNAMTFVVGDVAQAARHFSDLLKEPGLLNRLSANALGSLKGKYTFAGSMDAWAEALDGCLENPPLQSSVPKVSVKDDGRLARLGLSPRSAQRIRDVLGMHQLHEDPGSEWPTRSGLMSAAAENEILQFGRDYEDSCESQETAHPTEARSHRS